MRCSSNADRKPPPKILSTHKLSPPDTHLHAHTLKPPAVWKALLPSHPYERSRAFFFPSALFRLLPPSAALSCFRLFAAWTCVRSGKGSVGLFDELIHPPVLPPPPPPSGLDTVDMANNETGGWEWDRKLWMHLHLPELFTRLSAFVVCFFTPVFPSARPASAGKTTNQSSHFSLPPALSPLCRPFPSMLSPFLAWHNLKWSLSEFMSPPVN